MVVGHFATALIAKERDPKTPLWFYLAGAMLLDFLLVVFAVIGIEEMSANAQDGLAALTTLQIDMRYSHDIVPVVGWAVVLGIVAYLWWRRLATALWAFGLVIVHVISDLLSGFPHNIAGPDSPEIGLALYDSAPLIALAIELALGLFCVWWFTRRVKMTRWRQFGLYGVILFGVGSLLFFAFPA